MSIGENLRKIREKTGMNQTELAKAIGVTASMINQLEQDRKILTVPLGKEIAKALHCKVDDFLAG